MITIFITIVALFMCVAPSALAQSSEAPGKPEAVAAYEECAARVFAYSDKTSDVFKECEAQMDAFTEHLDADVRDKVRQRAMAETQREHRARKKEKEGRTGGG